MDEYPAGVMTVRGRKFEVLATDASTWRAYLNGNRIEAADREKLKAKLMSATKIAAQSVSVPFIRRATSRYAHGRDIRRGTATGVHSGNGNLLVTWDNGDKEQFTPQYGVTVLRPDADPGEWQRLVDAQRDAEKALATFESEHRLDLGKMVRAEMEKAAGASSD
jgi:hypothetical protein